MEIYLPIAGINENVLVLLGAGGIVGLLSGLFGVGGGFLLTPLLLFIGVPAPVAVASGANQVVGTSVSAIIGHWRRGNVDMKMGMVLVIGGVVGSSLGVWVFRALKSLGQIDLTISLCYVVLLGGIGGLMFLESTRALLRTRGARGSKSSDRRRHSGWAEALPLKTRFRKSRLYISAILPLAVGILTGVLSAIMGVGGGFIMVPALIYLVGMPTGVVVGTSLFQIVFVTANVTMLQAVSTQSVDVVLALLLLVGGVVGAQLGVRLGAKLRAEQLRILLALLVLAVAGKIGYGLAVTPADLYSITTLLPG